MVHDSRFAAADANPASPRQITVRLVTRRATAMRRQGASRPGILLPVIGPEDVILPTFDEKLGAFAVRAQMGDRDARDALYFAFLPKLERLMNTITAPAAPGGAEKTWNRDDIAQEGYLEFTVLIDEWAGDVSFTAFVLSRFVWRVRDAIRRGVGKPSVPPRQTVIPVEHATELADEGQVPDEVHMVLSAFVEALPDPLGRVVIGHLVHGTSKTALARELGVSRRTMVRYWQEIRAFAAEVFGNAESG